MVWFRESRVLWLNYVTSVCWLFYLSLPLLVYILTPVIYYVKASESATPVIYCGRWLLHSGTNFRLIAVSRFYNVPIHIVYYYGAYIHLIKKISFIVQLVLGLVIVFVVTTVTVVFGCWCGRKRRQTYQADIPEKGIPDNDNSGKPQLGLRVSLLDERKV